MFWWKKKPFESNPEFEKIWLNLYSEALINFSRLEAEGFKIKKSNRKRQAKLLALFTKGY